MIFTILSKEESCRRKRNGVTTMHIDMNKTEQMVQLFIKLNTAEKLSKKIDTNYYLLKNLKKN